MTHSDRNLFKSFSDYKLLTRTADFGIRPDISSISGQTLGKRTSPRDNSPDHRVRSMVGGKTESTATQRKEMIMTGMTRWNPFKEMDDLQKRLNSIFNPEPTRFANGSEETMTVAQWAPLVDITEDDKEYLIKAELPDVPKGDVKVAVENGVLTISGERKFEKEEKSRKYHRIERSYGSFTRSFAVPDDADDSKVAAEFKDGLLTVHLVKSEKARPKTVEVKVA